MALSFTRKGGRIRAIALLAAVLIGSSGLVVAGTTAAQAGDTKTGSSWYCKVTVRKPYILESKKMRTRGKGYSCTGYPYKLYVQLHRVEGWTHPTIAQKTYGPAEITTFPELVVSSCETKTGKHKYFGQTFMYAKSLGGPGGALISDDSAYFNPCDK